MPETLNIGVIGLGVMGQRMVERLATHPRLHVAAAYDASASTLARLRAQWPAMNLLDSAEAVLATPGLRGVYIASPPDTHIALSEQAFDAGLSVLCEKPLSVDDAAAQACIARINAEQRRAAVNFSLAASPSLAALQLAFGAASHLPLGALQQINIRLRFAAWPRPWQQAAGAWLSERQQGGFSREVLSHFIFVLQRVFGAATLEWSEVSYPPDGEGAETALRARLLAAGVPVSIDARVDGDQPDLNLMQWQASGGSVELHDWFGVRQQRLPQPMEALGSIDSLRQRAQAEQIDQWVEMLRGHSHSLPGFAEALAVQRTIEALLAGHSAEAKNVKQADRPDSVQDLTLAGQAL